MNHSMLVHVDPWSEIEMAFFGRVLSTPKRANTGGIIIYESFTNPVVKDRPDTLGQDLHYFCHPIKGQLSLNQS
jgi:hypothetical protein